MDQLLCLLRKLRFLDPLWWRILPFEVLYLSIAIVFCLLWMVLFDPNTLRSEWRRRGSILSVKSKYIIEMGANNFPFLTALLAATVFRWLDPVTRYNVWLSKEARCSNDHPNRFFSSFWICEPHWMKGCRHKHRCINHISQRVNSLMWLVGEAPLVWFYMENRHWIVRAVENLEENF